MAKSHSYVITVDNNRTEKEAFEYVLAADPHFINVTKESRRLVLEALGLDRKYARAFDLIYSKKHTNKEQTVEFSDVADITLIELKTTKKNLPNFPKGFFFGATANEFELALKLGEKFKFCFVTLHPENKSYTLLTLAELEKLIRTTRVQYQINL